MAGIATLGAGAKVTSETKIQIGTYSGREWTFSAPGKGAVKLRFYLVGDHGHQLTVGPISGPDDPEAKTFFDSYKLGT